MSNLWNRVTGRIGWVLLFVLAAGLVLNGQWMVLKDLNLIIGLLNTFSAILLFIWLGRHGSGDVPLGRALVVGGTVWFFNWTAFQGSLAWDVNWPVYVLVVTGIAMVFTLHLPWRPEAVPERLVRPEVPLQRRWLVLGLWLTGVALAMAGAIVWSKQYLAMYDFTAVMNWFFVLRIHGVIGDIASRAFQEWGRLWLPLLYLPLLLGSYVYILNHQEKLGEVKSLAAIFLLANLGSLGVIFLSLQGWDLIPLQVTSIHYNFYGTAKMYPTLAELWSAIGNYANDGLYRWVTMPATHPPFHVIVNWLLIRLTGDNPMLIGLLLGGLAWTGIVPVYLLGKELYNRELGYVMTGLYITMPSTLIINHVAQDGWTSALVAWATALIVMGCRRKTHGYALLAGLATFFLALNNYAFMLIMPAMFMLAIIQLRDQTPGEGFLAWMGQAFPKLAWFVLAMVLPYVLVLWGTGFKFDYLKALQHTMFYVNKYGATFRPWFIGVWQAWFGYFIHVGVPVTALFLIRWKDIFKGDWRNDVFPWAGLIIMVIPLVMATGRQETEREYMLFNVFVVVTAALALVKGNGPLRYMLRGKQDLGPAEATPVWRQAFFALMTLAYLNAMLIEMLVVDHW